jgi:hypothetical protein
MSETAHLKLAGRHHRSSFTSVVLRTASTSLSIVATLRTQALVGSTDAGIESGGRLRVTSSDHLYLDIRLSILDRHPQTTPNLQ